MGSLFAVDRFNLELSKRFNVFSVDAYYFALVFVLLKMHTLKTRPVNQSVNQFIN